MIFGIGPNPMLEEFEDEEGDYKISPFSVYVCDKQTWEKEHHCSDDCVDYDMRKKLEKAGFAEAQESIFEPMDISITRPQIHQAMEELGYVYNEEFGIWMASVMG
jgi:hypothetical protein